MTPASMGPFKAVTAGMVASEWAGASDPCGPAATDYQGLLSLMEEACRWVLRSDDMSRLLRPDQRVLRACTHLAEHHHLWHRPLTSMPRCCRRCSDADASVQAERVAAAFVALTQHEQLHVAAASLCALGTKLQQTQVGNCPCNVECVMQHQHKMCAASTQQCALLIVAHSIV
jgi:hypothetical protein